MIQKFNKTRQNIIDYYLDSLEKGIIPWRKEWQTNGLHYNPYSKIQYKGINQLLLNIVSQSEKYSDPRWMTFTQIKNAKFHLENAKGKGVPLEWWSIYDLKIKKSISIAVMNDIIRQDKMDRSEISERFRWINKTFVVFNAQHIEGIEPFIKKEYKFDINKTAVEMINNYAKSTDLKIVEGDQSRGKAHYIPELDLIEIPSKTDFYKEYAYLSTLLHECCHSTMSPKRLNREDGINFFGTPDYAVEELRAEIGSSFLCADIGLKIKEEDLENHTAYIQSWISNFKEKPEVMIKAISDATKICDYIEDKGELARIIELNKTEIDLSKENEDKITHSKEYLNTSIVKRAKAAQELKKNMQKKDIVKDKKIEVSK